MPKESDISRKWYVIDASGKTLGRVATVVATLLRGKHKPTFAPHMDCGDHVIVVNCDKVVLTGNKLEDKYYRYHSGYIGGLKEIQYKKLMAEKPEMAMEIAVRGMVPDTVIGRQALKRLRCYKGEAHGQAAQKPEIWAL
jgi:large subunit ribosomal protein L13